jgi:hypothetical protein
MRKLFTAARLLEAAREGLLSGNHGWNPRTNTVRLRGNKRKGSRSKSWIGNAIANEDYHPSFEQKRAVEVLTSLQGGLDLSHLEVYIATEIEIANETICHYNHNNPEWSDFFPRNSARIFRRLYLAADLAVPADIEALANKALREKLGPGF